MYAGSVEALTRCLDVRDVRDLSQLSNSIKSLFEQYIDNRRTALQLHPDKSFMQFIINGIFEGLDIGYTGPRQCRLADNWPSTRRHFHAILDSIVTDLQHGRMLGPFAEQVCPNFV